MSRPAPGGWLHRLAVRLCSAATRERIVEPILADLQKEHRDALARGRPWAARWTLLRGYAGFGVAMGLHAALPDGGAAARFVRGAGAAVAALTVVFLSSTMGPSLRLSGGDGRLILLALPGALALTVPAGLFLGVLLAMASPRAERPSWGSVGGVAGVAAVAVFVGTAWVIPETNQRFRVVVVRHVIGSDSADVARGSHELTLPLLAAEGARARREGRTAATAALGAEWHKRLALPAACLALALFGAAAAPRTTARAIALFVAVGGPYFALLRLGEPLAESGTVSPFVAAWLGNGLLTVLAAGWLWSRRFSAGGAAGRASAGGSAAGR